MPREALANLHRIGQLKSEPKDDLEFDRLLKMAKTRLLDAQIKNLSSEGRFNSAYSSAHAAALAALRWHGYRSENVSQFSSACPTRSTGHHINGGYWMQPTKKEIWPNTRAIGMSKKVQSTKFANCYPI